MLRSSWLVRPAPGPRRLRLYCFSYAGGSAQAYRPWQEALDVSVEVCAIQLPGRGARMHEPMFTDMPALVQQLAFDMAAEPDLPFAFFGHSLGAVVAFELARYCRRHALRQPELLVASGCNAPHLRNLPQALHELDDEDLIAVLRDYNGTPREALEHRELMAIVLPVIRADFCLGCNYVYRDGPPLDIPIAVFAGRGDQHVSLAGVEGWARESVAGTSVDWFDGDHFFIDAQRQAVLGRLEGLLQDCQAACPQ